MKKINNFLVITLIILIVLFLKLYKLSENPGQLNRDEAALAYNALLLKETGREEWGRVWPVALESFGDYKLIGYPAVLTIFFGFLGYSDWVVRLPAALGGLLISVLAVKLLSKLKVEKKYQRLIFVVISLYGTFYFYPRMAFEAILALFVFLLILYLLIDKTELLTTARLSKRSLSFYVVLICLLVASLLTYNTPLTHLPLLTISLAILFGRKNLKPWLASTLIILMLGMASIFALSGLIQQKANITIFNNTANQSKITQLTTVVGNYLNHFSPWFLVVRGGSHPWHAMPGFGHMPWVVYLFFWVGLVAALFRWKDRRVLFLTFWLLTSAITSATTLDSPHTTRSLMFIFMVYIFAGIGMETAGVYLKKLLKLPERYYFIILSAVVLHSVVSYQYYYHLVFPSQQAFNYQLGYKQAVSEAFARYPGQATAVVDPSGYVYILTAWYLKMDPQLFSSSIIRQLPDRIGFKYGQQVGQFHFIANPEDRSVTEKIMIYPIDNQESWEVGQF